MLRNIISSSNQMVFFHRTKKTHDIKTSTKILSTQKSSVLTTWLLCNIVHFGCGDKDGFNVPSNSNTSNDIDGNSDDCPSSWETIDGGWLDPKRCLAWSEVSNDLTWYEAISTTESSNDQSDTDYCAELNIDGYSNWRVPTVDELRDVSLRNHPFTNTSGDLWSSTKDPASSLVWTVNLDQPGMEVLLNPSDTALVRCVYDL